MASFKFVILFALIAVAVGASIEKPSEQPETSVAVANNVTAQPIKEDLADLLDQYFDGPMAEEVEIEDEESQGVREKRRICRVVRIISRPGRVYIIRRCY